MKKVRAGWCGFVLTMMTALGAHAGTIDYICPATDTSAVVFATPTAQVWKVVFVRFPQSGEAGRTDYPAYADHLIEELQSYFQAMTRGASTLDIEIVVDPENEDEPWSADHPASHYAPFGGCSTSSERADIDSCNVEIMTKIHEAYPAEGNDPPFWHNVDIVIMIHYDNASFGRCGIGGVGYRNTEGLGVHGLVPGYIEGFDAELLRFQVGATLHLFLGDCEDCEAESSDDFDQTENPRLEAAVGHEVGHCFGFDHPPFSGGPFNTAPCVACGNPPILNGRNGEDVPCQACGGGGQPQCDPLYVNMGRYSQMRGISNPDAPHEGLIPYHPHELARIQNQQSLGTRLADSLITSNGRNIRIPQIRDSRAKAYRVIPPGQSQFSQHFLLANHQGSSSSLFDAKYGGTGLLIWHMRPAHFYDLELPTGRDGNGRDSLEQNWCHYGGATDFWDGSSARKDFSSTTNPSTLLLPSNGLFQQDAENVFSRVGIENIRPAPMGSAYPLDMLVDIYVNATQYMTAPNGGEVLVAGSPTSITWFKREYAHIDSVSLHLSTDGGVNYTTTLGTGLTNTGTYSWTPNVVGTLCRVRLTGYDPSTQVGQDASDANFTLAVIAESSVSHSNLQVPVDSVLANINWNTLVATPSGNDQVRFFRTLTGGDPISPSAVTYSVNGTAHTAAITITPCDPGYWYYEVKSVNNGVTHWSTRTAATRFKVNACVTP